MSWQTYMQSHISFSGIEYEHIHLQNFQAFLGTGWTLRWTIRRGASMTGWESRVLGSQRAVSRAEPVASEASRDSGARAKVQGEGKRWWTSGGHKDFAGRGENRTHGGKTENKPEHGVQWSAPEDWRSASLCLLSAETKVVHHPAWLQTQLLLTEMRSFSLIVTCSHQLKSLNTWSPDG